jgi:Mu-like prophage major head subunit gpT
MSINTTKIVNLLRPGLHSVFGDYDQYPSQFGEIYRTEPSSMAQEIEVEMRMLGLAQMRPEGAPTAVDNGMGQRNVTTYIHRFVALSFSITKAAMDDNLYKTRFPLMVRALKQSMHQAKEILGASVLNNAFSAAYPIGDGKALCADDHPIDGGTVSNLGTPADLNEASLEEANIKTQAFKDAAGLTIMAKSKKLIVSTQNQFAANRLLNSTYRTGTNTNDISAIYNLDTVPEGYRVNQYLTAPNAWFLLTNIEGFKHFVRQAVETDVYTDFYTDNLLSKAVERYCFGNSNFRSLIGNQGPA